MNHCDCGCADTAAYLRVGEILTREMEIAANEPGGSGAQFMVASNIFLPNKEGNYTLTLCAMYPGKEEPEFRTVEAQTWQEAMWKMFEATDCTSFMAENDTDRDALIAEIKEAMVLR